MNIILRRVETQVYYMYFVYLYLHIEFSCYRGFVHIFCVTTCEDGEDRNIIIVSLI